MLYSLLDRTHPNATFAVLCEQAVGQLDSSWKMTQSDQSIQFYILQCERSQPTITRSVTINVDLSWSVYVRGRQLVSNNTSILSDIPKQISSVAFINMLLDCVKSSQLCPGNLDQDFVDLAIDGGGHFLGIGGDVVATVDTGSENVADGQSCEKTVRTSDCEMLSDGRCTKCSRYRAHLCVKRSRNKQCHEHTIRVAHDSHTT